MSKLGLLSVFFAAVVGFTLSVAHAQSQEPRRLQSWEEAYARTYSKQYCDGVLSTYQSYIAMYQKQKNTLYVLVLTNSYKIFKGYCDVANNYRAIQATYDTWVKNKAAAEQAARNAKVSPTVPNAPTSPKVPATPVETPAAKSARLFGALAANGPNDSYFSSYQLPNGFNLTNTMNAWKTSRDCSDIEVYVFDTGVNATHPDLKKNVNSASGYNFVNNNSNSADDNNHGSWASGVIAAEANNGQGIAGICWSTKIIPYKVMDSQGRGTYSSILAGFSKANSQRNTLSKRAVFNFSLSIVDGLNWEIKNNAKVSAVGIRDLINDAKAKNTVVVFSAGNSGQHMGGAELQSQVPTNLLVVGSVNGTGVASQFTNYAGPTHVYAPGEKIAAPGLGTSYKLVDGTSFSGPMVAGAVALYSNAYPSKTATQVRDAVISSSSIRNDPRLGSIRVLDLSKLMATP